MSPATEEIKSNNVNILLTNACSLSPKIESLHEYFSELDLHVALVTESWLSDGAVLDADVADLEAGTNLKILYKNRPKNRTGGRKVGGGSLLYLTTDHAA